MVTMPETRGKYLIITASPEAELREMWDDFLQNTMFATHYVTPDFFVDPFSGQGERFAVLAVEDNRINAVLTGLKVKNIVVSGQAVRPQTAFRDGVERAAAAASLINGVTSFAGQNVDLVSFYSWEPIAGIDRLGYEHEICSGGDQVVMLDLAKGPDMLFRDFSERRRTSLRKVMKQEKLDVKILETEAELAELYEIHEDWNRRKGVAPDAFESFQTAFHSGHRAVFIASHDGKVVAGTYLRFCKGGVIEYAANNSLVEYQYLRPNELVGWRVIEWACTAGFTRFSLGASHPFLARYGGEIVAAHRYQLDRTFLKRHTNRERVSRLAIKTYLSLPASIRRRIKSVAAKV